MEAVIHAALKYLGALNSCAALVVSLGFLTDSAAQSDASPIYGGQDPPGIPQADAFVVCHEPTRTTMRGVQHPLPSIGDVIDLTVRCARLTNPGIRPVGIAINTQALGEDAARVVLAASAREYGLPATDPVCFGVDSIVERLLTEFAAVAPAR